MGGQTALVAVIELLRAVTIGVKYSGMEVMMAFWNVLSVIAIPILLSLFLSTPCCDLAPYYTGQPT